MFNVISLLTKKLLKKKNAKPFGLWLPTRELGEHICQSASSFLDSDKPNNIVPYRVDSRQNLVNSIFLGKNLVISTRLNLYSKLNCF